MKNTKGKVFFSFLFPSLGNVIKYMFFDSFSRSLALLVMFGNQFHGQDCTFMKWFESYFFLQNVTINKIARKKKRATQYITRVLTNDDHIIRAHTRALRHIHTCIKYTMYTVQYNLIMRSYKPKRCDNNFEYTFDIYSLNFTFRVICMHIALVKLYSIKIKLYKYILNISLPTSAQLIKC